MANAFIRKLNDTEGNVVFPATRSSAVYFDDNSILQNYVSGNGVMKKATGDKNGKDITSYLSGLSVSGRTITFTKGDGSSGTITTQDTVYTHPSYTQHDSGFYKVTVDSKGHVSAVAAVGKGDITALGIPGQDTTYSTFKAATSQAAGGTGLVPAPAMGDQAKFLRADATWATPANTTYGVASQSSNGLMSASDKTKLDGIATGANKYVHPSYTAKSSGLYKVTIDATGHVSAATAVSKSDITALGIPGQDTNTTYSVATTDADGLMSSEDKAKLDGIASGANKYTHPGYTSHGSGFYKVTVDSSGHVSAVTSVTKTDITNLGIPSTNTTYSAFKGASSSADGGTGLVPAPSTGDQSKFLRADATWQVPTNTTYSTFKAATSSAAGGSGLVPAPASGANTKYLRGDATWQTPPNTTYSNATTSTAGLMSASDKTKLDGIAANANKYTHPSYTSRTSGLYKITVDSLGHVSAVTAVSKSDITALGIPGQDTNTTYTTATQSANGLMSAADKKKLDGLTNSIIVDTSWGSSVDDLPTS